MKLGFRYSLWQLLVAVTIAAVIAAVWGRPWVNKRDYALTHAVQRFSGPTWPEWYREAVVVQGMWEKGRDGTDRLCYIVVLPSYIGRVRMESNGQYDAPNSRGISVLPSGLYSNGKPIDRSCTGGIWLWSRSQGQLVHLGKFSRNDAEVTSGDFREIVNERLWEQVIVPALSKEPPLIEFESQDKSPAERSTGKR